MKKILFLCTIFWIFTAQANCIFDIYTAGVSADSFSYTISDQANNENEIGSTLGLGVKLGQLTFCPQRKLEVYSYYRFRYFNLAEAKKRAEFSQLKENVFLNSLGSDIRFLVKPRQELLLDIEVREDYAPAFLDESRSRILDEVFFNLKTLIGYRHFLLSNRTEDYTLSAKIGALVPLRSNVDVGRLGELNLEYFRRISRKYSIRADLYFLRSQQDMGKVSLTHQELGARFNYLVRF
jgi:hypothetical protein